MAYSLSLTPPRCLYLIVNWNDLFGDTIGPAHSSCKPYLLLPVLVVWPARHSISFVFSEL